MWSNQGDNLNTDNKEEVPWLFITLAKGVSTFAGLVSTFFGIWSIISFSFSCFIAGVILTIEGIIVTIIEAPWAFSFINFANFPSKFLQTKPHWWKAVIYLLFAFIPYLLCRNLSIFFGAGILVIASGSYLVLSLGKKASLQEMRAKASLSENPDAVLVNNEMGMDKSNPSSFSNLSSFKNVKINQAFPFSSERPVY